MNPTLPATPMPPPNPNRQAPALMPVLRTLVRSPRPLFLDVGAKEGKWSRHLLETFPEATLHAFEPLPANFADLQGNLGQDPRVQLHPTALARTDGTSTLHVTRQPGSNSLLVPDPRARQAWGADHHASSSSVPVSKRSLDSLAAERGWTRIDFMKMDVQGMELEILRGAESLLQRRALDVLFFEMLVAPTYVGQPRLHEPLEFLSRHGYAVHGFHGFIWREGRLMQMDCLAVREELLAPADPA